MVAPRVLEETHLCGGLSRVGLGAHVEGDGLAVQNEDADGGLEVVSCDVLIEVRKLDLLVLYPKLLAVEADLLVLAVPEVPAERHEGHRARRRYQAHASVVWVSNGAPSPSGPDHWYLGNERTLVRAVLHADLEV